ncbi:DNA polymerase alpha/epsilon subunit B-domain-containing protein [Mucor mucedo]|uniref:DNA polymerase alpha/epsilon subunit B-domain-containing protein n=1 Tax=Mucor mucedo TaxID=29922 RepID=UPI00221F9741|nr:DNA polymerase alpha/epsilon subunit B-domain-containing protein [Mucor mucedo]KAI7893626.1 DNA polymerase alpha/epsilon subunit B-domain-containing protein [Mucor mucedo]
MSELAASEFCSAPTSEHELLERQASSYDELEELKQSLLIKKHTYKQQYASIYYIRLLKIRQAVFQSAQQRWGSLPEKPHYVEKILDIQAGQLCYMLGTVYLEMSAKPNVMNNLQDEESIIRPNTPAKYKSDHDVISLEDESGRVEISGSCLGREFLVTGMVVGILGKEVASGAFEALDICLPGMPEQDPLPENNEHKYVAILSGLNIGGDNQLDMRNELLSEFLTGQLGSSADQASSSTISRVILAGNSVFKSDKAVDAKKPKKYGYDSTTFNASPMLQLDDLLEEICSTVDVDIMPGPTDPSPLHLPQQPMHPSMFKKSHNLSTFHSVTNPYWCKIDDITFLGTSGQNIDDLYKYLDSVDRMKMAESCMYWRHMAPSAPDTLWAYPFTDRDPFVLDKSPHVYFIGNQPQFEETLLEGPHGQKVRIILVPSFAETGIMVLVNLSTLECSTVHISEHGMQMQDSMDES